MHRNTLNCYCAVTFSLLVNSLPALAQDRFVVARADEIQTLIDTKFGDGPAGIVIGLIDEQGSRVFSAGKMGDGSDRTVGSDSIFELCSVTKVFTSLLLLDAARRGEMNLDDPVQACLPADAKVPSRNGKSITLRNLAAQDSGLPFNPIDAAGQERVNIDAYTASDLYRFLSTHKLAATPGEAFLYSNTGFALLGQALERQTGRDFETLVVERIARPLGMQDTRITLTSDQRTRQTRGHNRHGAPISPMNLQVTASAGALRSTADDLLKFLSAALGFKPSPITPLVEESLVVRHRGAPRYGNTAMPWFDEHIYSPPGSELLAHGGGNDGYRTFLGVDKIRRRGVVVLSNQSAFNSAGIGWTLLQELPLSEHNITTWVREIVGIGVALGADESTGEVQITSVFPLSPAGQAGLSAGLVVKSINGVSVTGKSPQECVELIAGPIGEIVRLEFVDPPVSGSMVVELKRQKFLTSG